MNPVLEDVANLLNQLRQINQELSSRNEELNEGREALLNKIAALEHDLNMANATIQNLMFDIDILRNVAEPIRAEIPLVNDPERADNEARELAQRREQVSKK